MFRRTPKSNWKNLGYYLSMAGGVQGEVTDIKATDPADLEKPFEIEFNVSSNDFLDWSSKKLKVQLPFPRFNLSAFEGRKPTSKKPLELGPPIDITYKLKLTFPAKYQARLPLPLKVNRDYAEYAATYKLEGQTLLGERTLRMRQRELSAERLHDYQAFVAATHSDAAQALSLETTIAGTPAIPDSAKTEELMQAAQAPLKNGDFDTAEQLLKRVVAQDPKHKTVRRDLGYVLTEQNKYDEAVQVLREQTKMNPFDDHAYNMLGRVFWQQQDYVKAEESFRKQIEVTPLDQYAHSNLGQLLVEARKYKEAVPELERAISLSPEEVMLHVSLGSAYLHLSENQKAINAFEEALKIDRGPGVLNDVAYFLAEKGVQLDKAQRYAESAVTTLATDLRNLEAENLEIEDLEDVASLAAYWDTLGWVHFKKGDLDTSEKFLKAAWLVYQASDVAYHLGMLAETRGKKDEALGLYAQGTAALRTMPEARESFMRLAAPTAVEKLLEVAKRDLREHNVFTLGQLLPALKAPAEAEFYIVFAPDATRNAQVVDVKFIKGADSIKPLASQLKTIKYQLIFPDSSPTKIVRRGALLCLPKPGACTFTMVSPELISSID